jgi:hypothetical protein
MLFAAVKTAITKYEMSKTMFKLIMQNSCKQPIKRCNVENFADWLSLKSQELTC